MLFNNNTKNDFIKDIQNHECFIRTRAIVRFNRVSLTSTVVRCSTTQKKAFINIHEDKCELVLLDKLKICPQNLKNPYKETGNHIFNFTIHDIDSLARLLYDHLMRKSEFLISIENGEADKLTPTFTFASVTENNVFVGRITKLVFDPDYVCIETTNGKLKLTGNDSKNLLNLDNSVGRYLIMNSKKEFIIVPGPILRQRVKEM